MNSTDKKIISNTKMLRGGLFPGILSALFFLSFFSLLHGHVLNAQTPEKMTLSVTNTPIEEVLNQIESQSKYRFLYNKRLVDVTRRATVKFNNQEIESILRELFKNTIVRLKIGIIFI